MGLILAASLATPAVAEDVLSIESARPVALDAAMSVASSVGAAFGRSHSATGEVVLGGATGSLTIVRVNATTVVGPTSFQFLEDPSSQAFELHNATLLVTLLAEPLTWTAEPAGAGRAGLTGRSLGDGAPARLPTEYTRYTPSVGETAYRRPDWAWKANWTYAASGMPRTPDAFPTLNGPGGLAAGEVTISVEGGLLRFVDDRDIERSIRLGLRDAEAAPFVAERQLVRMFFDGEIGSMATPPAEIWGIAGPDLTWTIDGTSRWTDARVSGTVDGRKLDSHKTDLLLEGAFAVVPDPGAGTFASPHEYAAEGRFARVEFDGRPMVAVSNSSVSNAVVTLSLAALLLGLLPFLWKAAVALYTRNHVSDVLDHPTRRRILELIEARPGLHKSGIRKEVGGAWGPFEFHLRALVAAGCVRTERERGFVLVYPTGERPAGPLLTPSTRRVYEAVPPDGAALGVVALRERLGMSRQRLRYHVNALERLHLVRLRPLPDGSFTIERNAVVTNTANTGAAGRTGVPGSNG